MKSRPEELVGGNWLFKFVDRTELLACLLYTSHPSKVMLKIILNELKPQAEKIIAEEQAGFRAGRSTTEHFDRNASSILFGEVYVFYVCCQSSIINSLCFFWVFLELKKKPCFTQVKCSSNNSRSIWCSMIFTSCTNFYSFFYFSLWKTINLQKSYAEDDWRNIIEISFV